MRNPLKQTVVGTLFINGTEYILLPCLVFIIRRTKVCFWFEPGEFAFVELHFQVCLRHPRSALCVSHPHQ